MPPQRDGRQQQTQALPMKLQGNAELRAVCAKAIVDFIWMAEDDAQQTIVSVVWWDSRGLTQKFCL